MNTTETLAEALRDLEEAARKVQSGEMPADSIDLDRRNARAVLAKLEAERAAPAGHVPEHLFFSARLRIAQRAGVGLFEETNAIIRETLAELRATSAAPDLQNIEQYRMQMAGISSAALGYWQESDSIHPDYDTVALRDVAKLYAKYDKLYKAAGHAPKPAVQGEAQDAARYRWLAAHCRSTPEHWRGRWSIVIEGPAPERQDCEDAFDAAIDAAMQAQEGGNV